jgi:hypothetical protein
MGNIQRSFAFAQDDRKGKWRPENFGIATQIADW